MVKRRHFASYWGYYVTSIFMVIYKATITTDLWTAYSRPMNTQYFNPLISMTTFFGIFCWQLRRSFGLGILEFHFFIFQNFDCEPKYACFSILLYPETVSLLLHLSLCTFSQNKALGLLNHNLLKSFRISQLVPEIFAKTCRFC
jgi:hypothetical protein